MKIESQKYKAVFIDLDGTLLNHVGELSDYSADIVNSVIKKGNIKVFINTGRSVTGAMNAIEKLIIDTPLICYNSLVIYDHTNKSYIKNKTIETSLMKNIIDVVNEETDFFLVSRFEKRYTLGSNHYFFETFSDYLKNCVKVDSADNFLLDSVVAVSAIVSDDIALKLADKFIQNHSFRKKVVLRHFPVEGLPGLESGKGLQWCYIHQYIPGKCEGFDFLEEKYNIPKESVIAIGDSSNDYTMIQKAGLGIAVANAEPEIKEVARHIIGHNSEDSVANFLKINYLD